MTNSKKYKDSAEKTVRDIRRRARRHYSAEEKIRVVLEVLRGEDSIAELCRREGINSNVYYRWSKEFLEADKSGGYSMKEIMQYFELGTSTISDTVNGRKSQT